MVTNKYSKIYFNIMNVAKERVKPETITTQGSTW